MSSSAPRLEAGIQLLGQYQGSGYVDPRYLIARSDHQVIHVSRLLFLVASSLDGSRDVENVADLVSRQYGKALTSEGVDYLVSAKLRPLGIVAPVAGQDGHGPAGPGEAPGGSPPTATPLLGLRLRRVLFPEPVTNVLGATFEFLYRPFLLVPIVLAVAAADVWLWRTGSLDVAVQAMFLDPVLMLAILGLLLVAVIFHEIGHAAACRYGGGRPRAVGVALFVVFPAFYTDVTDAYRLSRRARLRTDLGGIYFNVVFIGLAIAGYAATGSPVLFITVLLVHIEMLQQLIPIARLDGYYILTDVVGVPDLFGRVRPVIASLLPGRDGAERLGLRPIVRVAVTVWVLTVIPLLLVILGWVLLRFPQLLDETWAGLQREWATLTAAVASVDIALALVSLVSLLLLPLPVLGLVLIVGDLVRRVLIWLRSRVVLRHELAEKTELDGRQLRASDFTDERMLRPRIDVEAVHGWRKAVVVGTRGRVAPQPSRAEQHRRALLAAVCTPAPECRRVVVLSRKGGAGKTTTALMLGHVMASHRGDRVVAIDANPDAGTLADRLGRRTSATITDLLRDRDMIDRYTTMRRYTSQSETRLEVLGSDDDPQVTRSRRGEDYRTAIDVLDHHYSLVLIDTGTGILEDAVQGILGEADQVIVVMPPALDGARAAAMTLDWLEEHGHEGLVEDAIVVINGVRPHSQLDLRRVEAHFAARCGHVQRIPWDDALEAGARTALSDLGERTREAFLELAARVGAGFARPAHRVGRLNDVSQPAAVGDEYPTRARSAS
jgi:putative peptide zinc metalloprotease protein